MSDATIGSFVSWKKQRDLDMGSAGKCLIFGIGARIAQLDDLQGAGFALHETAKKA